MTREEATERIKIILAEATEDEYAVCYVTSDDADALVFAIKALEAPPNDNWEGYSSRLWKSAYERGKADAEQRWIPVSERLPKIGERVMVTVQREFDEETIEITTYFKYGFYVQPVVAWIPLPKTYKVESEEVWEN